VRACARLIARLRRTRGCASACSWTSTQLDIERAAEIGAQRIELYTGPYALAALAGDAGAQLDACARAAERAAAVGLELNAGHDLDQRNLGPLLRHVPSIREVSIGHALIGEALFDGLELTVRRYLGVIAAS
jgi:pyridoxine 5-phosphate synthase